MNLEPIIQSEVSQKEKDKYRIGKQQNGYASKFGTQQWPQDWERSVLIPIPKKDNARECSNYCTIALISHTSKVMLKIPQDRLQ